MLSRNGTRQPQAQKLLFGQAARTMENTQLRQQQPGRRAHLRPAAVEAAPPSRRVLDRHQHRAAPLAAEAEALQQAQHHQQDRRPRSPMLAYVGSRPIRNVADAHDQQRQAQHRLAADLVAEVAEDDAAQRARDEADREGGERRQRADQRVERRERTAC